MTSIQFQTAKWTLLASVLPSIHQVKKTEATTEW